MSLDTDWLRALRTRAEPVVLVTLARAQGSVPREAGTKMLVARGQLFGTIGGGHLELRAGEIARELLCAGGVSGHATVPLAYYRFPLGPSLGQCCGGVAELVFELLPWPRPQWVAELAALLEAGRGVRMVTPLDAQQAKTLVGAPLRGPGCELRLKGGAPALLEHIVPCDFHIMLFGAGHVGRALVNILGALPCTVTWVDGREAQFPKTPPENVRIEIDDVPQSRARGASAGAYYLVMTHEHALDQAISEAILRRGDFAWFGLIGSVTKRRLFERRLVARGIAPETLARMRCPIGIAGIAGKAPGVIAVAVAAQLLAARQAQLAIERTRTYLIESDLNGSLHP